MVFGHNHLENARKLSNLTDIMELVLFRTVSQHNISGLKELQELRKVSQKNHLQYTVHLPSSLEIASAQKSTRQHSIALAVELINLLNSIAPIHFVLHVPYTKPTLTPRPGNYFQDGDISNKQEWQKRTWTALQHIHSRTRPGTRVLLENINYSPTYLEPFLDLPFVGLCLDVGHLLLGKERINYTLRRYLSYIEEIHLHGVSDLQDHQTLDKIEEYRLQNWLQTIKHSKGKVVINLEVFSPEELYTSKAIIDRLLI